EAVRVITDHGDRSRGEVKTEVNRRLGALKSAAKGSDTNALKRSMDDFNEALQKIGQHIYQGAGAGGGTSSSAQSDGHEGGESGEKKKEEDVVDADYREVN